MTMRTQPVHQLRAKTKSQNTMRWVTTMTIWTCWVTTITTWIIWIWPSCIHILRMHLEEKVDLIQQTHLFNIYALFIDRIKPST